jgi:tRNA threonylcarbamoyl adenosine modification protein YjeE
MTIACVLDDADATERLGEVLSRLLLPGDVVLLVGDLGAGKTTLVRGLVRGLGGTDKVTSPTFTLRHEYQTTPALTHVDCWRLAEPDELDDLGLDEVIADGGALVIEWGEFADFRFGDSALHLSLSDADGGESRLARLDLSPAAWSLRSDRLLVELERSGLVAAVDETASS